MSKLSQSEFAILIVLLGSLTPWIAPQITTKGLFKFDAGPSEDHLSIISIDRLC